MSQRGIAVKDKDAAGGAQLNGGQDIWSIRGDRVVLLGDPVTPHGPSLHNTPVMAEGSSKIRVNGIPVCLEGHKANCGHATTGRANVRANR